jgi:transposase-like protein
MELDSKVLVHTIFIKKGKEVSAFIIYETVIQIGNQQFWLWFCIEPLHSSVLGIYISEERNMLLAENFIRSLVEKYGIHTEFTLVVEHGMMKHVIF